MIPQDIWENTVCPEPLQVDCTRGGHARLVAAPAVQRPQDSPPGSRLSYFLASLCAKHKNGCPSWAGSFNPDNHYKVALSSPGYRKTNEQTKQSFHDTTWPLTPADLVKLCLETLRQKKSSPFKGHISQTTQAWAGMHKGHSRMWAF